MANYIVNLEIKLKDHFKNLYSLKGQVWDNQHRSPAVYTNNVLAVEDFGLMGTKLSNYNLDL